MGTVEIIIVFSALMALIALVTIGIDWLGKPLRNRRFIPRMYRFEDEKLPVDFYGNTTFEAPELEAAPIAPAYPLAAAPYAPPLAAGMPYANAAPVIGSGQPTHVATPPSVARSQPAPRQVARLTPDVAASRSAFTDSLDASGQRPRVLVSNFQPNQWEPGMPLDTTVNDNKPNLAVKAERFWMSRATSVTTSHFGQDNRDRMAAGKAPRRHNPRTSRSETMLLTGLREASEPGEVRMRWPEESVDPWSGK